MDVRESLTQAMGRILQAIPKPQPPPPLQPQPVTQPAVEFPLGKGQLGQIFHQLNNYTKKDPSLLDDLASADVGKVRSSLLKLFCGI